MNADDSDTSASMDAGTHQLPVESATRRGGTDAFVTSKDNSSPDADVAVASPADESIVPSRVEVSMATAPKAPAATKTASTGPRDGSDDNQRSEIHLIGAPRVEANTAEAPAAALRLELPDLAHARVDDGAVAQPASLQTVTARAFLSPRANVDARATSVARTEPTSTDGTVSSVVLAALATAGLGPLATNGPLTPFDSPLGLALAAWGTRPRQSGQPMVEENRSPGVGSTLTGQGSEAETFAAAALLAVVNSPPSVPTQPVGKPNAVTGVVTGAVIATDPDSDALTFSLSENPTAGTVTLNPLTGAYRYLPATTARLAAAATPSVDTDSFIVSVSDGQSATTAPVSVYIAPIRLQNQTSIAVGFRPSAAVVSPDGQRLYVANAGSRTVSVINTSTGRKIDANPRNIFSTSISVGSSPGALALSSDGKRLYVANTGSGTVSVINTDTYARIDANPRNIFSTTITVGSSPSALAYGPDGRLYVANRGSKTVSVIDTATNTVVDTNPSTSGKQSISVGTSPSALALGPDGRLFVANSGSGTVSVINTNDYSVATIFTVGMQPSGMTLGADGRLYVTNTGSNSVSVIDTVTNTVIDANPDLSGAQTISVGPAPTSVALSPADDLAYVVNGNDTVSVISTTDYSVLSTVAFDSDTSGGHVVAVSSSGTVYVTDAVDRMVRVLALNATVTQATTLTLLGGSVTITGDVTPRPLITADGTRAVIVTPVTSSTSQFTRVAVIDTATGRQVGSTLTLAGGAPSTVLSSDGTRAFVTTNSTLVTVINTATGTLVGTTTSATGSTSTAELLGAAESRYQVITQVDPESQSTQVTVVDTTTGTETGSVLVTGVLMAAQQLGVDGTRILVTTQSYDSIYDSTTAVTRAVVIDAPSGTQLGTTLELTGFPGGLMVSADGKHALITSQVSLPYDWHVQTTYIAMLDTNTGTQTGATISGSGESGVTARFSADSSRLLFTTYDSATDKTRIAVVNTSTGAETAIPIAMSGQTTDVFVSPDGVRAAIVTTRAVAVVNVLTGAQIGSTQGLIGQTSSTSYFSQFTGDGARLVLATPVYNMSGGSSDTRIAVLNMIDGTLVGSPAILPGGFATGAPFLTVDDTRVLVVTDAYNGQNRTYSTKVAVFDTLTGNQAGSTLTLDGRVLYRPMLLSENGTHAAMAATTSSIFGSTTRLVVVNTLTGAQTVSISIPGAISGDPVMTPDGTHLLVTTTTAATLTSRTTRVSVFAIS
ncbi:hypothetical protein CRI77_09415 [Mycolicibacterium duvalii]|uniref:hypothetical protein n=1 Tax=Mycolicibacterium duvalii TaxID=39688 RepID=UPI000BEEF1F0|nr:hypothetical protein [Mycolicibacterium duvalii]MCV7368359.1 hypothetical protein [Mycolicibacterium duvalii]PEG41793.1 hypothetical protein CRI77_09415 [Mycolicibacterium duvalii]